MGGMRTAGDLVLRMQLTHKMKINEAKKYLAEKLGVSLMDLSDVVTMTELAKRAPLKVLFCFSKGNQDTNFR
jgi:hypothetical protein